MVSEKDRKQVVTQVRHAMLEFGVGDLEKAGQEELNFLVAIGCMVATEFPGGLVTGKLGLRGSGLCEERFEAGFVFLGKEYRDLLHRHKERGI